MIGGYPLVVRNFWVSRHNLDHIEVSQMDRIQMGSAWVSGIHGFYSSMYHDEPIIPEYDGILDEVRVFIHEALTRPSICSLVKLGYWMLWMASQGMNPIAIVLRHGRSIHHLRRRIYPRQGNLPVALLEPTFSLQVQEKTHPVIVAKGINGYSEAQVQHLYHQFSSVKSEEEGARSESSR